MAGDDGEEQHHRQEEWPLHGWPESIPDESEDGLEMDGWRAMLHWELEARGCKTGAVKYKENWKHPGWVYEWHPGLPESSI